MKTQRVLIAGLALVSLLLLFMAPAMIHGQETADTPSTPATETEEKTAAPSADAPAEPAADVAADEVPSTPPEPDSATPERTSPPADPSAEASEASPAAESQTPAEPPSSDSPEEILNPAATEEAAQEGISTGAMIRLVAILLALFIIPILIGNFVANSFQMPDHGWKIAVALGAIAAAVIAISTGEFKGGPDLSGGITLIYELADPNAVRSDDDPDQLRDAQVEDGGAPVNLDDVIDALKKRIDPAGTKEVTIRRYGDAIEIIIPKTGKEELDFVKRRITEMGNLEFRITADSRRSSDQRFIEPALKLRPDQEYLVIDGRRVAQWVEYDPREYSENIEDPDGIGLVKRLADGRREVLVLIDPMNVIGDYITTVGQGVSPTGGPSVLFNFDSNGAARFGELTGKNLPGPGSQVRYLGIILDKRLISSPSINNRITSSGEISGQNMTEQEVEHIIGILHAGKLPAELNKVPISEAIVSPTLGLETIRKGTTAIIASLIAVLVFMVIYYRFAGLVACMALVANLVLTVGTMYLIGAAFTLPGLAGLVLTIGMSVDANVLIFERIREELDRGAALRMAIRNGFARATTTIIDSNLTTLITGFVLYAIGTDQLRGFAITLIIGITMSMFTAIFCSRIVFDIAERRRWITRLRMMRIFTHTHYDFMSLRTPAIAASLVLIAVGIAAILDRGKDLLDIDFTGGTSVTMVFKEGSEMPLTDVRQRIAEETDLDDHNLLVVERGTDNSAYTINTSIDSVEQVEETLEKIFQGNLKTYSVEVRDVVPSGEGDKPGTQATLVFGTESDPDAGITHDALMDRLQDSLQAAGHEGIRPHLSAEGFTPGSNQRVYKWQVRLGLPPESAEAVLSGLANEMSNESVFPLASKIGGRVAGSLQMRALYATLISLIGVMGYIWLRFQNFAFSLAAVVALVHDVLVTVGCLALSYYVVSFAPAVASFLQMDAFQIGLSVLAAILTLIGYSLNDTIVTFDRIREVKGKSPQLTGEMINQSINQTLSRTLLTFFTTFLVVGILYFYGGPGIHAFSFALLIGLIVGTYSSIYIAAPILLWFAGAPGTPKRSA